MSNASSPSRISEISARVKPEHAQAGQLAAALRQRDARRVVDDAERDDAGEDQVDEDREVHVRGHDVAEALKHGALEAGAGDRRRRLQRPTTARLLRRIDRAAGRRWPRRPRASSGAARSMSMYADKPMMSSTRPVTWTRRVRPLAFEHFERDGVAGRDAEHVGRASATARRPRAACGSRRPSRSTMRLKRGFGGTPVIARYRSRWPDANAHGHRCAAARRRSRPADAPARSARCSPRGSTKLTVTSCRSAIPELRHDQPIDRVDEDEADHQDRDGERDAEQSTPRPAADAASRCAAPCGPAVPRWRATIGVSSSERR